MVTQNRLPGPRATHLQDRACTSKDGRPDGPGGFGWREARPQWKSAAALLARVFPGRLPHQTGSHLALAVQHDPGRK